MKALFLLFLGVAVICAIQFLMACQPIPIKGKDGSQGQAGAAGQQGIQGPSGSQGAAGIAGPVGITGVNGTNGQNGSNGVNGVDATPVTIVNLCPGIPSYPGVFIEVGICLNHQLYGVYSANGGFMTLLPPGDYSSSAIGSACNLTISTDCIVSH